MFKQSVNKVELHDFHLQYLEIQITRLRLNGTVIDIGQIFPIYSYIHLKYERINWTLLIIIVSSQLSLG
jgi:hypothetical protein